MKSRTEVDADKLRGGFYTPDPLVDLCWARVASLKPGDGFSILEPSAGDGAFLRGLGRSPLRSRAGWVQANELFEREAAKCSEALAELDSPGRVICGSAIRWAAETDDEFDVAVGNPPFVRFQFVDVADRYSANRLAIRMGVSFTGVSNLWLPILLGALGRLRVGGAFAFVLPAECFTGVSAGSLREWLVRNSAQLRFDLFVPGSFPGVLQEVVVLSGRRCGAGNGPVDCTFVEHMSLGRPTLTNHLVHLGPHPWTRYLLSAPQLAGFEFAVASEVVKPLGMHARFGVAAVTGANAFFSVDEETLRGYDLGRWSRPLLPRIKHAPGLAYTDDDHAAAVEAGSRAHLLDFSAERDDPNLHLGATAYLDAGEEAEIHLRYKCRIRDPWFRVPHIRPGQLMLSKRSHHYPRVVVNDAGAVTTDTIYRGCLVDSTACSSRDLAASFHNSLTLLSAELQGRSFGGGVLELVPSEVARLHVPVIAGFEAEFVRLDSTVRERGDPQLLVDETDKLVTKAEIGLETDLVEILSEARIALMSRRLERNRSSQRLAKPDRTASIQ